MIPFIFLSFFSTICCVSKGNGKTTCLLPATTIRILIMGKKNPIRPSSGLFCCFFLVMLNGKNLVHFPQNFPHVVLKKNSYSHLSHLSTLHFRSPRLFCFKASRDCVIYFSYHIDPNFTTDATLQHSNKFEYTPFHYIYDTRKLNNRKGLVTFRTSNHLSFIETGRYDHTLRVNRLCSA